MFAVAGVHFVSLQSDDCTDEIRQAHELCGVTVHAWPDVDLRDDPDDTAALIKALDLVIAIPTSTATLAAALGLPCWMLTSGFAWQKCGARENPWHPTARHLERGWERSWEDFLGDVALELRTFALAPKD